MKRWAIVAACVLLLLAVVPWSGAVAQTQPMTLAELQAKYPHGAYWNHTKGGNEDYTWSPCTHHTGNCTYNGSCGCNTYKNVAIQCMGFAYQVASLAYGVESRSWTANYNKSALDTLKAGDIVRYRSNSHSIFVTAVEGDAVTFADGNGDGHCKIQWNRTTTKAELKKTFTYVKAAPYALPQPPKTGLELSASTTTAKVGQNVTLTLTYRAAKEIGGILGGVRYDAQRFAYVSCAGDGVEVSAADGVAKFVYCADEAKAPTTMTFTLTFGVTTYGGGTFTVTTDEWVDDEQYTSLGTPSAEVTVRVDAPTLTISYHGGGGKIPQREVGRTYRVLSDNGINMRKDAGTSQTKVSALPYNTEFTVATGDTKEANGYVWGKTTYNGKTGWVVISDFVEQIGTLWDSDWKLTDGVVYRQDGTKVTDKVTYGQPMATPIDPATWGLSKDGCRFGGWNTAADGSGVAWVAGMLPEALSATESVVLYAVWNPILPGDVDGNGRLNNKDLGLMQRYLNGWNVSIADEADINGDGTVNNRDFGLLQKALNEEKER